MPYLPANKDYKPGIPKTPTMEYNLVKIILADRWDDCIAAIVSILKNWAILGIRKLSPCLLTHLVNTNHSKAVFNDVQGILSAFYLDSLVHTTKTMDFAQQTSFEESEDFSELSRIIGKLVKILESRRKEKFAIPNYWTNAFSRFGATYDYFLFSNLKSSSPGKAFRRMRKSSPPRRQRHVFLEVELKSNIFFVG